MTDILCVHRKGCSRVNAPCCLKCLDVVSGSAADWRADLYFGPAPPPPIAPAAHKTALPTDAKARKNAPMDRGLLRYFPLALAYVAEVSRIGNEQHNPGQPMHWAKEKSTDHGDCLVRHQCEAGTIDTDKVRHSGKVAWRALAQLQIELEKAAE